MRPFSINLMGRVKNFDLPKHRPLVPLYEAIVNSVHAIEERQKNDPNFLNGEISIRIMRDTQNKITENELPDIEGFEIIDNGIGFTENNMDSFLESDSTHKSEIGGKGVGRFSWLKAFAIVDIASVYCENNEFHKREFSFTLDKQNIDDVLVAEESDEFKTTVRLNSYLRKYKAALPKQLDTVAMRIMQHCLVYFLDKNCPRITITDNWNWDTVELNQLFKQRVKTADNTEYFNIGGNSFSLLHVEMEDKAFGSNRLYLCANNRLVDSKDLEKQIINLDGQIFEKNGFWYVGVLTSKYLDDNVDMNRLSFDIPDKGSNLINDVSLEAIMLASCERVEKHLSEYLTVITDEKNRYIEQYVTNTAPQYRHLLKYMPEEVSQIKPKLSADKLDDELHNIKRKFDKNAKQEQQRLLDGIDETNMNSTEYEQHFQKQFKKISDANSAMLAEYVVHRKVVIELLSKGINRKDDGKFNKESYIHELIYPMRATSDEIDYETHNLWLIDEKLSYCSYISSDIYFDNDPKQERTDILVLDNPVAISECKNDGTVFDTIVIFELKRPMKNDYTDKYNPIKQLYSYVRKIKSGEAKDKYHRAIHVNESTKYYLYAVCDITPKLQPFIDDNEFTKTPDNLGWYKFNKTYNAYFEILSYDKILNDARKRNRVLFDKLGINTDK
jgi:hypothetical protein